MIEELIQHAKQNGVLHDRFVKTVLALAPLEKALLAKGKVYYFTEPITGAEEQRAFVPVASQVVEYLGFDNLDSDKPGTPAAHLFRSRLLGQEVVFRLSSGQFRQLFDDRKIFLVVGKAVQASPASPTASRAPEPAKAPPAESSNTPETQILSTTEDPGFAAVIQALGATTLQFQSEDRVSFQSIITDILQAQRVFNTLHDVNQTLGIVLSASGSFASKVNQWENRFTAFFQQNRPEKVGMTTINNLKSQQNKGRGHLGSAKYQFGKLISNLEQAKINNQNLNPEGPICEPTAPRQANTE